MLALEQKRLFVQIQRNLRQSEREKNSLCEKILCHARSSCERKTMKINNKRKKLFSVFSIN
jgi:hypothetical protein